MVVTEDELSTESGLLFTYTFYAEHYNAKFDNLTSLQSQKTSNNPPLVVSDFCEAKIVSNHANVKCVPLDTFCS
jgi:hypothetical protein